jgi:hypothetical protein
MLVEWMLNDLNPKIRLKGMMIMKFRKFNTEKFHELYDNACDLANKAEKELVKECKAELE